MQEAVPSGKGAMLAVLGLKVEEILEQINSISINGTCEVANDNSPGQIVISGDKNSIQILQDSLKKKIYTWNNFACKCTISLFFNGKC